MFRLFICSKTHLQNNPLKSDGKSVWYGLLKSPKITFSKDFVCSARSSPFKSTDFNAEIFGTKSRLLQDIYILQDIASAYIYVIYLFDIARYDHFGYRQKTLSTEDAEAGNRIPLMMTCIVWPARSALHFILAVNRQQMLIPKKEH